MSESEKVKIYFIHNEKNKEVFIFWTKNWLLQLCLYLRRAGVGGMDKDWTESKKRGEKEREKESKRERNREGGLFILRTDHLSSVISDALFDDWITGYKSW